MLRRLWLELDIVTSSLPHFSAPLRPVLRTFLVLADVRIGRLGVVAVQSFSTYPEADGDRFGWDLLFF